MKYELGSVNIVLSGEDKRKNNLLTNQLGMFNYLFYDKRYSAAPDSLGHTHVEVDYEKHLDLSEKIVDCARPFGYVNIGLGFIGVTGLNENEPRKSMALNIKEVANVISASGRKVDVTIPFRNEYGGWSIHYMDMPETELDTTTLKQIMTLRDGDVVEILPCEIPLLDNNLVRVCQVKMKNFDEPFKEVIFTESGKLLKRLVDSS